MRWKVLGLIVFAIIIAVFTLDNTTSVNVNFIFVTAKTELIFVILLSILLGMILMAILWSLRAWKLRSQTGSLKKQLTKVENELEAMRKQEEERIQQDQMHEQEAEQSRKIGYPSDSQEMVEQTDGEAGEQSSTSDSTKGFGDNTKMDDTSSDSAEPKDRSSQTGRDQ